jgi:hypothetical protein
VTRIAGLSNAASPPSASSKKRKRDLADAEGALARSESEAGAADVLAGRTW